MKKLYFSFFLVLSLLFIFSVFVKKAYSEELTFSRAYQDYQYNSDLYNKAHADYELARASYLQYKTLVSKNNAQEKTLTMLSARDQVVITYLTAIRTRLKEVGGVPDDKRQELFSLIDSEVSWFMNHKQTLTSAGSLDDLVSDSNEVKAHFPSVELLIYKTLTQISVGKVEAVRLEEFDILNNLKTKITEIKSNGDKDTAIVERGTLEIESRIGRSQSKNNEALGLIGEMKLEDTNKEDQYNSALDVVGASLQYLKDAGAFFSQIIINIETKD